MTSKHLFGGIFALLALIVLTGVPVMLEGNTTVATPAVPGVDRQVVDTGEGLCSADAAPMDAVPAFPGEMEEAACSRCPDGSPQCWSDKQCDSFCGGKGYGDCVRINSCYQCCLCAL
jgi:hypothetical protein